MNGSTVADALVRHGHPAVTYQSDMAAIPTLLRELLQPGDILLTLGAGDVWKVGDDLVRSATPKRKTTKARKRS